MTQSNTNHNKPGRIGLVDYDLNNFHADVYLETLRGALADRGFVIAGATAVEEEAGRQWCQKNEVLYFDDVDALDDAVDYYMVLAPSNPGCHLSMCEQVFSKGKMTYVDKTFAPNHALAQQIFELADRHEVAIQTSSALRYTQVQSAVQAFANGDKSPVRNLAVWGGGDSVAEYAIHPLELAVSCLGADAQELMTLGTADHPQWILRYTDGRLATIDFNPNEHVPYAAALTTDHTTELINIDLSQLFVDAAAGILDFFLKGMAQIDRKESLLIRQVLDLIAEGQPHRTFVPLFPQASVVPKPHLLGHVSNGNISNKTETTSAELR